MSNELETNEQLLDRLSAAGKVLTPNERQRLSDIRAAAAAAAAAEYEDHAEDTGAFSRALLAVPTAVNLISDIGNAATVLGQALIPASLPILLIVLIYAESERVRHGVMLFESHAYLAWLVSYAIVFGNAFLELSIQYQYAAAGVQRRQQWRFSLRLAAAQLGYALGFAKLQKASPAARLESLQSLLTIAILFLAIAGSMRGVIETAQGNWRQGAVSIITDSTLLELMTWLGGLVSAVVIVLLAQKIVEYSYEKATDFYHELLGRQGGGAGNGRKNAVEDAKNRAERDMLLALLAKHDAPKVVPSATPVQATNGNGNGVSSAGKLS